LHNACWNTEEVVGSTFRAQHFRVGNPHVVTGDANVEVVLKRQRYRVVHRKIDLAIAK